jgi:hypothetical protein
MLEEIFDAYLIFSYAETVRRGPMNLGRNLADLRPVAELFRNAMVVGMPSGTDASAPRRNACHPGEVIPTHWPPSRDLARLSGRVRCIFLPQALRLLTAVLLSG